MALRNIRKDQDPSLYKRCRPVDRFDAKLGQLIDDMFETMYKNEGCGLAASQVGVLRRVAVVDAGERKLVLINPQILERDGRVGAYEGCLSFPGKTGYVERAEHVVLQCFDRTGEQHTYEAHGYEARAIQHELDHLDGVVYLTLATEPPEGFMEETEDEG